MDDLDLDARLEQEVVEVVAGSAVQRVDRDAHPALSDDVEIDLVSQLAEVSVFGVDGLDQLALFVDVDLLVRLLERVNLALDLLRDFGQRRRAVGSREFQSVVFGRIVRGGEVDRAHRLAADSLE